MTSLCPMAALLLFLTVITERGQCMPRSRSRSPLYSPSTDVRPGCCSDSSRDDEPVRRSRSSGCVSDRGLFHTPDPAPSIFTSGVCSVEQEPDATITSQQLQAALRSDYAQSHHDFINALLEQVFSYQISPPLQRTLLLIYIQDHRDRLQRQQDSGLFRLEWAFLGLPSFCAVHSCEFALYVGALHSCQELCHPRTKLWRTARWQGLLARRSKPRARKVRGKHCSSFRRFFATCPRVLNFLRAWCFHICDHHWSSDNRPCKTAICPSSEICPRLSMLVHLMRLQSALGTDIAYQCLFIGCAACVRLAGIAKHFFCPRFSHFCACSPCWRSLRIGLGLNSGCSLEFTCITVGLLLHSLQSKQYTPTAAYASLMILVRVLVAVCWQDSCTPIPLIRFSLIRLLMFISNAIAQSLDAFISVSSWCSVLHQPCPFARSRLHCRFDALYKYNGSFMMMWSFPPMWTLHSAQVTLPQRKFLSLHLVGHVQHHILDILILLPMCLAPPPQLERLLGSQYLDLPKLHISYWHELPLGLMLVAGDIKRADAPCGLPGSGGPNSGRVPGVFEELAGMVLDWYPRRYRRTRFLCRRCDFGHHKEQVPLRWKLLDQIPLPRLLTYPWRDLPHRLSLMSLMPRTLTTCLRSALYIRMILMICFALTAMLDLPLRYVHMLCRGILHSLVFWTLVLARKTMHTIDVYCSTFTSFVLRINRYAGTQAEQWSWRLVSIALVWIWASVALIQVISLRSGWFGTYTSSALMSYVLCMILLQQQGGYVFTFTPAIGRAPGALSDETQGIAWFASGTKHADLEHLFRWLQMCLAYAVGVGMQFSLFSTEHDLSRARWHHAISCIYISTSELFLYFSSIAFLAMDDYTREHPEPKKSWDMRPALPRRRYSREVDDLHTPAAAASSSTRDPLPRLRTRAPLPRLKTTLKQTSRLRLRRLQHKLKEARSARNPLPRLRHGRDASSKDDMEVDEMEVPAGSRPISMQIQGRWVEMWDISSLPIPPDQPRDEDDEIEGAPGQDTRGHFPMRFHDQPSAAPGPAPSGSRLRALGRQPKKRKCVKKPAAKTGVDATTSTTIRPRPKSARKPPAKARGSIRESLKVDDPGQRPVAVPLLRKAKCKAASTATSAKSTRQSVGTTKPTSSGCENDDQHHKLMETRKAELLEAQRAAFSRRVELRRQAILAATAKAASTSPASVVPADCLAAAPAAAAVATDMENQSPQSGRDVQPAVDAHTGARMPSLVYISFLAFMLWLCLFLDLSLGMSYDHDMDVCSQAVASVAMSPVGASLPPVSYLQVSWWYHHAQLLLMRFLFMPWPWMLTHVRHLCDHCAYVLACLFWCFCVLGGQLEKTVYGSISILLHYIAQRASPNSFCEPSGPKSRADPPSGSYSLRFFLSSRWLRFLILFTVFLRVGGARVASDATEAGSQELLATATSGGRLLSTAKKRAFHRAQRRAQVAGGTFYKGRWCTARSLHVRGVDASADARAPRPGTFRTWQQNPKVLDLNIISWNSSGLGAAVLPEFLLWLDQLPQESRPNIVLIQESHWRFTSEYRHGNWLAYHNGVSEGSADRYAGLLTLIRVPGVSPEQVRVHNVLQGRLTHVRIDFPTRNVDILHVYQHAASTDPSRTIKDKRRRLFNRLDTLIHSMPGRNLLVVGGDFNQPLPCALPYTGSAICVPSPTHPDHCREGNTLLHIAERHDLVALNTFHCRPSFTFQHCAS